MAEVAPTADEPFALAQFFLHAFTLGDIFDQVEGIIGRGVARRDQSGGDATPKDFAVIPDQPGFVAIASSLTTQQSFGVAPNITDPWDGRGKKLLPQQLLARSPSIPQSTWLTRK